MTLYRTFPLAAQLIRKFSLALWAFFVLLAPPIASAAVDVDMDALGRNKNNNVANIQPVQVAKVGDAFAFSFQFRVVGRSADAINWGFPVKETAATQWVKDNKNPLDPFMKGTAGAANFSGLTEGLNHAHDKPLDITTAGEAGYFGFAPATQLSLWMQPAGTDAIIKVGNSDLKHAFATTHDGVSDHFLLKDEQDTYNNFSNADRDFLGPISELDFTTFKVDKNEHLGFDTGATFQNATTNNQPFKIFERDHGEKDETSPLTHRLVARQGSLLTQAQGGTAPAGSKWFFGASIFVFDTSLATPGREQNLKNNSIFRQFDPGWNGANLVPLWIGDSLRLKDDGLMNNFIASNMDGAFIEPMTYMAVPEPQCIAMAMFALPALFGSARRARRHS